MPWTTGPMPPAFADDFTMARPHDEAIGEPFRCYCGVYMALGLTRAGELYWYHVTWSPDADHEVGKSGRYYDDRIGA